MIHDELKNAMVNTQSSLSFKSIKPKQFKDKQHEYYNDLTRTFYQEYAKYSSDFVEAEVQGLNPDNPAEYTKVHLRFSEMVKPSGALSAQFDDYKYILIAERQYDYLRRGAKIKAMGNIWLVRNPTNMSSGGTALIQRCDTVWNYLDYYGNVCSEPMCIDTLLMRASTPDSQRSTMITKGYFNAYIQYNKATKQLFQNSRMILGSSAYMLTGFSDFQREFTEEPDSIQLMQFALRYDEPNDAIDDMENRVAGGKTFAWDISVYGEPTLNVGETQTFTASSVRTYGGKPEAVESTEEHPITYLWTSSNEEVLAVDTEGNATAVGEGEAVVTATLEQNPNKTMEFPVTVAAVDIEPHVGFLNTIPKTLSLYESVLISAAYYENGKATEETITWNISGADEESYSFVVEDNSVSLKCWGGSINPVVITASYGDYSTQATIYLEGL